MADNIAFSVVKALCPQALPGYLSAFEKGAHLLERYDVNSDKRLAHFLAQVLHETGGLTLARESMNYRRPARIMEIFGVGKHSAAITADEAESLAGHPEALAERVYGLGNPKKARELGNTQSGDGFKFRGGGLLQTTGRGAYARYGDAAGVDFEGTPDLIASGDCALYPALIEWRDGGCGEAADEDEINRITRRINGGYNGLPDRKLWLDKAVKAIAAERVDAAETFGAWSFGV